MASTGRCGRCGGPLTRDHEADESVCLLCGERVELPDPEFAALVARARSESRDEWRALLKIEPRATGACRRGHPKVNYWMASGHCRECKRLERFFSRHRDKELAYDPARCRAQLHRWDEAGRLGDGRCKMCFRVSQQDYRERRRAALGVGVAP